MDTTRLVLPATTLGIWSGRLYLWPGRALYVGNAAARTVDAVVSQFNPARRPRGALDPRVERLLGHLRERPGLRMPAAEAASLVGLSSTRFQHLFRESTGIPFRRYLLWLRLVAAVEQVANGSSLTEAAHGAGFADSAHLSRSFRRMFGLSPSALAKGSQFVQASSRPAR